MGIILGRFRKKASTFEQLEKLDSQIRSIEDYGKSTELKQKKVAGRFVLVSVFVYVVTALVFYFYFFPKTVYEGFLYVVPLIAAPLVIVSVKRVLTWWYNRKLRKNFVKLSSLKDQKKKMLDNVMETETYKVAKKILEKFAPDEVVTRKSPNSSFNTTNLETSLALSRPVPLGLRYRGVNNQAPTRGSLGSVLDKNQLPSAALKSGRSLGNLPLVTTTPMRPTNSENMTVSVGRSLAITTPRLPMTRNILPRERTAFDKLVDYLVGDGPSNRYALICRECSSHNGMALREEFEYLSFHCCYCHTFNPSKKQRPPAPKLGASRITPPRSLNPFETSDSEKNSPTDSDSDDQVKTRAPENALQNVQEPITSSEATKSSLETASGEIHEEMDVSENKVEDEAMETSGDKEPEELEAPKTD